jgi:hypothetical protein
MCSVALNLSHRDKQKKNHKKLYTQSRLNLRILCFGYIYKYYRNLHDNVISEVSEVNVFT